MSAEEWECVVDETGKLRPETARHSEIGARTAFMEKEAMLGYSWEHWHARGVKIVRILVRQISEPVTQSLTAGSNGKNVSAASGAVKRKKRSKT